MLKKVCCGVVIPTISLLLTPCLSVVGMAWLLLLLVNIIEIFRSGFCEKHFLPLIFSWCVWGAKWKGLFVFQANVFRLLLGFDTVSNMVPKLFSYLLSFCRSEAFSFNIDFTWYWEFIILLNNSTFYGMWFQYCFVPVAI